MLSGNDWITEFRNRRIAYGVSQNKLAVSAGITREYLNKIEGGKMKPSQEIQEKLNILRGIIYAPNEEVRDCILALIQEPEDRTYSVIPSAKNETPVTV